MSRSRRAPFFTDGQKSAGRRKKYKRAANNRVKNADNVPNGAAYKKFSCSYDICDYSFEDRKNPKAYRK